jgi:hypothetical protein
MFACPRSCCGASVIHAARQQPAAHFWAACDYTECQPLHDEIGWFEFVSSTGV